MMKSFLAIACAALMTCGLQAQISGSINRGAAKVSNSIEMGGNKLSVNYTALRFGDGMCSLHIAFGKQHVMVPVMAAKKK